MLLLENEGIYEEIRQAFVVCLASHSRPIAELLRPNLLDIEPVFNREFQGMARMDVQVEELTAVREKLFSTIHTDLTENERAFILSVKECRPDWSRLPIPGLDRLPGIRWKLMNLERMEKAKHRNAVDKLKRIVEV